MVTDHELKDKEEIVIGKVRLAPRSLAPKASGGTTPKHAG